MTDSDRTSNGLFASARRLLDGGLATVENRLELFSVELKEEKLRLLELLLLTAGAVFFAAGFSAPAAFSLLGAGFSVGVPATAIASC